MQLALTVQAGQDDQLLFAQQLGVDCVLVEVRDWEAEALAAVRNRVEQTGLRLAGIESLPRSLYGRAIVGLPGREAQVDQVCQAVRRAGAAGISLIGYRWTPPGIRLLDPLPRGRGEALIRQCDTTGFRQGLVRFTAAKIWDNLSYFLERVLPVAEEAGVRLACHPDDPPVSSVGDAACILNDVAGLRRLLAQFSSPNHGLDLCLGSLAAMPGVDLVSALARFDSERIFLVHLRNLQGTLPRYSETFLDEGKVSIPLALKTLHGAGFRGLLRAAAPPGMVEDTPWGHKGRAFDLGYLKAVLQVLGLAGGKRS